MMPGSSLIEVEYRDYMGWHSCFGVMTGTKSIQVWGSLGIRLSDAAAGCLARLGVECMQVWWQPLVVMADFKLEDVGIGVWGGQGGLGLPSHGAIWI